MLDFVAGWFVKAGQYISTTPDGFGGIAAKANKGRKNFKDVKFGQGLGDLFAEAEAAEVKQGRTIRCGFVSTNSITQGEQVGVLWAWMLAQGIRIRFAHRTFQWTNDAPGKAAVHCVIVGFGMEDAPAPRLFEYDDIKGAAHEVAAKNINPYLVDAPISDAQREAVSLAAQGVLDARAVHQKGNTTASLADLYNPSTMPANLSAAHKALDKAVDGAYGKKGLKTDAERVAYLFTLYEQYTSLLV